MIKRPRYYVTSQGTGRSVATPNLVRLRLPAAMIDELLRAKLQSFLADTRKTNPDYLTSRLIG
jgi:hypothetical protein